MRYSFISEEKKVELSSNFHGEDITVLWFSLPVACLLMTVIFWVTLWNKLLSTVVFKCKIRCVDAYSIDRIMRVKYSLAALRKISLEAPFLTAHIKFEVVVYLIHYSISLWWMCIYIYIYWNANKVENPKQWQNFQPSLGFEPRPPAGQTNQAMDTDCLSRIVFFPDLKSYTLNRLLKWNGNKWLRQMNTYIYY